MKEECREGEQVKENESKRIRFHRPSQLFLVRLSVEDGGKEHEEWHGKVQHAVTGETYLFHSRSELTEMLLRMMPGMEPARADFPS